MYFSLPVPQSMGMHVLPGLLCLILSSLLLSFWELRRLTKDQSADAHPWFLPASGITVGIISFAFIVARFVVIHLSFPVVYDEAGQRN